VSLQPALTAFSPLRIVPAMTTQDGKDPFQNPDLARRLIEKIRAESRVPVRLMEVCGTHTMAIFRQGIRSVIPEHMTLLSGPGCPVCVTAQGDLDAFVRLSREPGVILTTFGDLMRVPGSRSSLERERGAGRDIRVVYSTFDALEIARANPDRRVIFLGVGFETTAPTIAAALLAARDRGIGNFLVYSALKRVVPALRALMTLDVRVDGFILPGHVSVIIGMDAYRPFFAARPVPCAVAGFEPVDILGAILALVRQIASGAPDLANAYGRVVTEAGNVKALALMDRVFEPRDARWRGLGLLPESGLSIREDLAGLDASRVFGIETPDVPDPRGCACGAIITGAKTPPDCPLYRESCTPMSPVGPCMVSSEGTCAAYYRYHG